MIVPFVVFVATYFFVLAKSMQQLNVCYDRWRWVPVLSYAMGYLEYLGMGIGVADVVTNGYWRILILGFMAGTGGWLGSWSGMWLHKRLK